MTSANEIPSPPRLVYAPAVAVPPCAWSVVSRCRLDHGTRGTGSRRSRTEASAEGKKWPSGCCCARAAYPRDREPPLPCRSKRGKEKKAQRLLLRPSSLKKQKAARAQQQPLGHFFPSALASVRERRLPVPRVPWSRRHLDTTDHVQGVQRQPGHKRDEGGTGFRWLRLCGWVQHAKRAADYRRR